MESVLPADRVVLADHDWRERETAHHRRVDQATEAHQARRQRQEAHPVEDFLFTYYSYRPGQLRRWHPGGGVALSGAAERASWPGYRIEWLSGAPVTVLDLASWWLANSARVTAVRRLLRQTLRAEPHFGCFGWHEWAMVYRTGDRRHASVPLRLGSAGTDAVVEAASIRCSHHDAFRFFTAAARPRNALTPAADPAERAEQPGCLHATMDIYKWAFQLGPLVGSDLVMDAFCLAAEIRELDMRASPYDLSGYGYEPVPVETSAGRAEYVRAQRGFAARGQELRSRLLGRLDACCPLALTQPALADVGAAR